MPKLVLNGVGHPWSFELQPGLNRLGRNPTNDFRVSDASVSSFHCEVTLDNGSALVKDLVSTNGTFINGVAIREATLLPGQTLTLGSAELRLDAITENYANARVAIPEITAEETKTHGTLEDGAPACLNHADLHAAYRCSKCGETFCDSCVHKVGLQGSKPMIFCATCSAPCEGLAPPPSAGAKRKRKYKGVFGRLTQTLKLPFQRRRSEDPPE